MTSPATRSRGATNGAPRRVCPRCTRVAYARASVKRSPRTSAGRPRASGGCAAAEPIQTTSRVRSRSPRVSALTLPGLRPLCVRDDLTPQRADDAGPRQARTSMLGRALGVAQRAQDVLQDPAVAEVVSLLRRVDPQACPEQIGREHL